MLRMFTCDMPAGRTLVGHGHARIHLLVVAAGELQHRDRGGSATLISAGGARLSPANAEHHLEFGAHGARCTIIEAVGPYWTRLFARGIRGKVSSYCRPPYDFAPSDLSLNGFDQLLDRPERIRALGRLLAHLEHGESVSPPAWVEDAMMELDNHRPRAVAGIANVVDRNRAHFSRGFAKCFGLRPTEYRNVKRVLRALEDVAGGTEPLSSIALAHGYSDQSHMTNAFRVILGRSPSAVRAQAASCVSMPMPS